MFGFGNDNKRPHRHGTGELKTDRHIHGGGKVSNKRGGGFSLTSHIGIVGANEMDLSDDEDEDDDGD